MYGFHIFLFLFNVFLLQDSVSYVVLVQFFFVVRIQNEWFRRNVAVYFFIR